MPKVSMLFGPSALLRANPERSRGIGHLRKIYELYSVFYHLRQDLGQGRGRIFPVVTYRYSTPPLKRKFLQVSKFYRDLLYVIRIIEEDIPFRESQAGIFRSFSASEAR